MKEYESLDEKIEGVYVSKKTFAMLVGLSLRTIQRYIADKRSAFGINERGEVNLQKSLEEVTARLNRITKEDKKINRQYKKAQLEHLRMQNKVLEWKLSTKTKQYVKADDVQKQYNITLAAIKQSFRAIGRRVAPLTPGMNIVEIIREIDFEVLKSLDDAAELISKETKALAYDRSLSVDRFRRPEWW
ncbi:MAG: hypothetical protein HQK96_14260 [Nitrospirae bacterium]|nr:hypothetical protein [Nitrospirota bacterium]